MLTPIESVHPTAELSWMDLYLLSGAEVSCPSSARHHQPAVKVWRLAFRCSISQRDTDNVDCAYPTAAGVWHVAGAMTVMPVPNGTMLNVTEGATTGFWFIRR